MSSLTMGSRVLCALKKSSILTKFHIRDGLRVARDNHLFYGGSCRSVCGGLGRLRDGQCSFVRSVQISQLQLCSSRGLQDVRQPQTNPPPSLHSTLTINPEEEKAKEEARSNKYFKVYLWSTGILLSATLALLIYINAAPKTDEEGNVIEDEFTRYSLIPRYLLRFLKEVSLFKRLMEEPVRDTLLPEPLSAPYRQPPYTLCLELRGVLVHPEWSYLTGWRFKKRPGVDFLLQQLGMQSQFEIVIYTDEDAYLAYPLIDNLDPQGFIMYRLFKDSTRYQGGEHLKELRSLNRPINRVIHVDWNEKAVETNRSNSICLKKWEGDMDDRTLVDLAIFLKTIADSGVDDVRGVLEYYSQFEDPLQVFRENQRKLQEQQQQEMETFKSKTIPSLTAFRRR